MSSIHPQNASATLVPRIIKLPKIREERGCLTYLSEMDEIPFSFGSMNLFTDFKKKIDTISGLDDSCQKVFIVLQGLMVFSYETPGKQIITKLQYPEEGLYFPARSKFAIKEVSTDTLLLVITEKDNDTQDISLHEQEKCFYNLGDCRIVNYQEDNHHTYKTISIYNNKIFNISIKRVFYIYDVPEGENRGAHAHKSIHQIIYSLSGGFDIELYDGKYKKIVHVNKDGAYIIVPPGIWADLNHFSGDAICLVLASGPYDKNEYIYSLTEFNQFKNRNT